MTDAKTWKLGLSIGFERGKELEKFETCAAAQIDVVEISLNERLYPTADWDAIGAASKQTGVAVWSVHLPFYPFVSINIADPDPAVRESTLALHKEGIDHAAALGAKVVVIHPSGEPNPDEERAQRMIYAKACLKELADYAEQYGITVAVEDLPRTCLGNCIADIEDLISADPKLRVCFDTNHLLTESDVDFVKALGDKIVTLHVSDYDFLNERHWWPYEGKVNWVEVVKALEAANYAGPFLYECGIGTPPTIVRERKLTMADYRENYQACVEKRPWAAFSTPDEAVCAEKAYFATPKINA